MSLHVILLLSHCNNVNYNFLKYSLHDVHMLMYTIIINLLCCEIYQNEIIFKDSRLLRLPGKILLFIKKWKNKFLLLKPCKPTYYILLKSPGAKTTRTTYISEHLSYIYK